LKRKGGKKRSVRGEKDGAKVLSSRVGHGGGVSRGKNQLRSKKHVKWRRGIKLIVRREKKKLFGEKGEEGEKDKVQREVNGPTR